MDCVDWRKIFSNVPVNSTGWVSITIPNVPVTNSTYYAFTLNPSTGMDAIIDLNRNAYSHGSVAAVFYDGTPPFIQPSFNSAFIVAGSAVPEPSTYATIAVT
jgi:hypothetical protein